MRVEVKTSDIKSLIRHMAENGHLNTDSEYFTRKSQSEADPAKKSLADQDCFDRLQKLQVRILAREVSDGFELSYKEAFWARSVVRQLADSAPDVDELKKTFRESFAKQLDNDAGRIARNIETAQNTDLASVCLVLQKKINKRKVPDCVEASLLAFKVLNTLNLDFNLYVLDLVDHSCLFIVTDKYSFIFDPTDTIVFTPIEIDSTHRDTLEEIDDSGMRLVIPQNLVHNSYAKHFAKAGSNDYQAHIYPPETGIIIQTLVNVCADLFESEEEGDIKKLMAAVAYILKLDPKNPDAYLSLAAAFDKKKMHHESLIFYKMLNSTRPRNPETIASINNQISATRAKRS